MEDKMMVGNNVRATFCLSYPHLPFSPQESVHSFLFCSYLPLLLFCFFLLLFLSVWMALSTVPAHSLSPHQPVCVCVCAAMCRVRDMHR